MIKLFKSLIKGKSEDGNGKEKKNFEILKYDGLRAQRMGRIDYAVKCFLSALEIEEEFEILNYLSEIYIKTGETEKAKEMLLRMVEQEPELPNTYLVLANVYFMEDEYSEMAKVAQKAIDLDDKNALAYYLFARACHGLKDEINSVANLTKAIALKEDFMEAYLMRAEVLIEIKQYKEAMEDVEAILGMQSEEENALLLRGKIKQATGKEEEAENDFRTVTELNPFNEHAYIDLGQLYISQKKLAEAIELFDEAIELNPNSASAYYERGRAKLLNGDKEGSSEDMKTSLQLNPKDGEKITGQFDNQTAKTDSTFGGLNL